MDCLSVSIIPARPLVGAVPIRPNVEELGNALHALVHPNRLQLLLELSRPKLVSDLRLTPASVPDGENPDRPLSRQAVQAHLDQLVDVGLVRALATTTDAGRAAFAYVVDHARLFALAEDFRTLARTERAVQLDPLETSGLSGEVAPKWPDGPKLVIVHGLGEGTAVPLALIDRTPPRGWVIGRGDRAHVRLTYDPFVSSENAEIVPNDRDYHLLDLRTSLNGTYRNWRRLPVGGEVALENGDIIGVGRTLLLFREK